MVLFLLLMFSDAFLTMYDKKKECQILQNSSVIKSFGRMTSAIVLIFTLTQIRFVWIICFLAACPTSADTVFGKIVRKKQPQLLNCCRTNANEVATSYITRWTRFRWSHHVQAENNDECIIRLMNSPFVNFFPGLAEKIFATKRDVNFFSRILYLGKW